MQAELGDYANLEIIADAVEDLRVEDGVITGAVGASGTVYPARRIVLTTGTFLKGVIHLGDTRTPAGRVGDAPSIGLADRLYDSGLAHGAAQDGHARAPRRQQHRLGSAGDAGPG